jgi:hypothetical protein
MLLIVGAMALLATLSISVNTTLVENDQTITENGLALGALGLAQGMIEEAGRLYFDEAVVGRARGDVPALSELTPADSSSLEIDGPTETYPDGLDDVDDLNGFDQQMAVGGVPFRVQVWVGYVEPDTTSPVHDPAHLAAPVPGAMPTWTGRFASTQTYTKKMEVMVSADHLPTDLIVSHLFAFRP